MPAAVLQQNFRDLAAERLAPPKRLKPSEWTEQHRILSAKESAEPGPVRLDRTPYVRGIIDEAVCPTTEEIVFVKGVQIAGSESGRHLLGFWIDNDPDPTMLVMPTEDACVEQLKERIRPMLQNSPALARHVSPHKEDNTTGCINLATMPIYFGWSGSPQSLATRPCRRVLFDECDKYEAFSGREADPISLGTERTTTYGHRRLIMKWSTPTTEDGAIWQAYLNCGDKRHYVVPCPHCKHYQRLVFDQIKGFKEAAGQNKVERADSIQNERLAFYECEDCLEPIRDWHKPKMLQAGMWISEGQTVSKDGGVDGLAPKSKRVGFHLSGLYSPWLSWGDIAAKFVLAQGDPGATQNFRNSVLAEPHRDVVSHTRPSVFRDKANNSPPPLLVPRWCQALIATADTQKDWFALAIRAWGWGYKSQLVYHTDVVGGFEQLYAASVLATFKLEGGGDRVVSPQWLLIDSGGDRTGEVYDFALTDPQRIVPTKGQPGTRQPKPWTTTLLPNGLVLRNVNVDFYKDKLTSLIHDADVTLWLPYKEVSDAYCMEMASEHKTRDRKTGKISWQLKHSGARNEAWDLEVLQLAAADMANLGARAKEPVEPVEQRTANPLTNWKGKW
jgi:phage terminase large subunit GpA-like protein